MARHTGPNDRRQSHVIDWSTPQTAEGVAKALEVGSDLNMLAAVSETLRAAQTAKRALIAKLWSDDVPVRVIAAAADLSTATVRDIGLASDLHRMNVAARAWAPLHRPAGESLDAEPDGPEPDAGEVAERARRRESARSVGRLTAERLLSGSLDYPEPAPERGGTDD